MIVETGLLLTIIGATLFASIYLSRIWDVHVDLLVVSFGSLVSVGVLGSLAIVVAGMVALASLMSVILYRAHIQTMERVVSSNRGVRSIKFYAIVNYFSSVAVSLITFYFASYAIVNKSKYLEPRLAAVADQNGLAHSLLAETLDPPGTNYYFIILFVLSLCLFIARTRYILRYKVNTSSLSHEK